jgi:hypothetical protein
MNYRDNVSRNTVPSAEVHGGAASVGAELVRADPAAAGGAVVPYLVDECLRRPEAGQR